MAGTETLPKTQAPSESTYNADHVTAVLEKDKNVNEAARELSCDIQHMSSADFKKSFQKVQDSIKDWNKTHTGGDALSDLQLVDAKGKVVADPGKATGVRIGDESNNTTYDTKNPKHEFVKTTENGNSRTVEQRMNDQGQPVKSALRKETKGDTTTSYDENGHRTAVDKKNLNGSTEHDEYDPKTGKLLAKDTKYPDGTSEHCEIKYDAISGNRISTEYKDRQGNTSSTAFDPATGNPEYHSATDTDGNTEETSYDPATGHVQATIKKDEKGNVTELTKYDPVTQNPTYHFQKNGDTTEEESYDPVSGQAKSRLMDYGNGHTERTEFDPLTGNSKSVDKTAEDGTSEHIEYDPYTRQPVSYDKKDEHGEVVEHIEYDPATGQPKTDLNQPQAGANSSMQSRP